MSTAQMQQPRTQYADAPATETPILDSILDKKMTYRPLGESCDIEISPRMVLKYLCVPTRSGKRPSEEEAIKYMMVCRQRNLNPWAGDCYLVGYDTKDGPKFSLIVSIQALLKRAEINTNFDGIESGVVIGRNGEIEERQGDIVYNDEFLVGGWARVHRKDRRVPFYQRLKLAAYDKGTPNWQNDSPGMIAKCAEAGALRQAFPSDVGGLYLAEEFAAEHGPKHEAAPAPKTLAALTAAMLTPKRTAEPEQPVNDPQAFQPDDAPPDEAAQFNEDASLLDGAIDSFGKCKTTADANDLHAVYAERPLSSEQHMRLDGMRDSALERVSQPAKAGKNQKTLA